MKNAILERYTGSLEPAEIAEGMNVANENAARLATDARILFEAGRHASAASLAALAIEEAGKVSLLRTLAVAKTPQEAKAAWKEYRSHRAKNYMWVVPAYAARGATKLDDLKDVVDKDGEHTALLDSIKQIGLYTDCFKKGHWSVPSQVIDKDLAKQLVITAEMLSRREKVISPREVELWVQFVGPYYNTTEMRDALLRWHRAMISENLSNTSHAKFEKFVTGIEAASSQEDDAPHH